MNINFLLNILSLRRPHGSLTEQEFANTLYETLPNASMDGFGNIIVEVGESRTLFSCHTDTVSKTGGYQRIRSDNHVVQLMNGKAGQSLGADDGAGVWMLCHMILENKPGLYIFHRGEECGGLGSKYIRDNNPGLLRNIDRAIAFDRKGTSDVITHQLNSRCCSDDFAFALANQLEGYRPSDQGIFTDTAFYTDLIGECTNVSVGYQNEHGPREILNLPHLQWLLYRVLLIDFEQLPTVRHPGHREPIQRDLFEVVNTRADDVAFYFDQVGVTDLDTFLDEFLWSDDYAAA